jgi:hypothetical protein
MASWFETRGVAALLAMRVSAHFDLSEIERPHSEERPLGRVSKDESPLSFQTATNRWGALQLLLNCCVESFTSSSVCAAEPFEHEELAPGIKPT